jgi:hypothetical protein
MEHPAWILRKKPQAFSANQRILMKIGGFGRRNTVLA